MLRFFKNCHRLSKPIVTNLLSLPILIICFKFTKNKVLWRKVQFKNKKKFDFNLLLIEDKKKYCEMLTLQ